MSYFSLWTIFSLLIASLLVLDLGVFQRKAHVIKLKEALLWSLFWIALSLLFNFFVYLELGSEAALQFFTGYLIEKSLSVDNLFVFLVLFSYFKVPRAYQHKVLYYGVLGAILFRVLFILGGVVLLEKFHWVIYLLGAFLIATSIRFLLQRTKDLVPKENFLLKFCKKIFPVTENFHDEAFFVKARGKVFLTPLFLVLLAVEMTDIIFATDSIPAIFAITDNPFVMITSNIFAVLGLRALYFALSDVIDKFAYLKFGLAAVLFFVGAKILLSYFFEIPTAVTLGVVAVLIGASIFYSLRK